MKDRITRFRKLMLQHAGSNPLFFLDTGAIIDFEKEVKRWKLKDNRYNTRDYYAELSRGLQIYVTEKVIGEVARHHEHHFVNGFPEISQETMDIVSRFHSEYCRFLKEISINTADFERVRWDSYWACHFTFPEGCKKSYIDPISCTDRETVETAIWARYALDSNRNPITSSTVISPDEHLIESIRTLTDQNSELLEKIGAFGYVNVRVLTSR